MPGQRVRQRRVRWPRLPFAASRSTRSASPPRPGPRRCAGPTAAPVRRPRPGWRRTRAAGRRGGSDRPRGRRPRRRSRRPGTASSASASAGERTSATPSPAPRRGFVPLRGRELLERLRQQRVEEDAGQEPVRLHRHTIGVVAVGRIEPDRAELVVLGRRPGPSRGRTVQWCTHRPSAHSIEALDRPRVDRPHPVQRRIGILDPLPVERHGGQRALQQRRLDPLPGPVTSRARSAAAMPRVAR